MLMTLIGQVATEFAIFCGRLRPRTSCEQEGKAVEDDSRFQIDPS